VHKLGKAGSTVVVPYRDADEARHLKVMGDLGQVIPMEWDIRNPDQIAECIRHSDTVYNLAGRDWETRNFSYRDVNVTGAKSIASVAADLDVPRLIHVSHLNADPNSESEFYRTKYEGEKAVREVFPEATIVRPPQMFGPEDWLLNAIASYPTLFHLNSGRTKLRPAFVLDVAEALNVMLEAPRTSIGSTFVLPGPRTYTFQSLIDLVSSMTLKSHAAPVLPKPIALAIATVLNRALWWPTISPDEVKRKYIDDAFSHAVTENSSAPAGWSSGKQHIDATVGVNGEATKTWQDLGIEPEVIENIAISILRRYRSAATYDVPVEHGGFKPRKAYHVIE